MHQFIINHNIDAESVRININTNQYNIWLVYKSHKLPPLFYS